MLHGKLWAGLLVSMLLLGSALGAESNPVDPAMTDRASATEAPSMPARKPGTDRAMHRSRPVAPEASATADSLGPGKGEVLVKMTSMPTPASAWAGLGLLGVALVAGRGKV
jgi:hypothetical protein